MSPHQQYISTIELGLEGYEGELLAEFSCAAGKTWLNDLPNQLATVTDDQLLYQQRNRVYRLPDPLGGSDLCIKAFKSPDPLRGAFYRRRGSKAQRAHEFARHLYQQGAAVTEPLGYMERWQGNRLLESYLISRYLENATDLYSEMTYLLRERPYASDFIRLLRIAAEAVRNMHDSGFVHQDLGPQNILLTRTAPADWSSPTFIDLNRGKLEPKPTLKQRARDMQRMKMPTHFLRIFQHIYFRDGDIPPEFLAWAERYRLRFYWHQRSRKFRHPIRTLKQRLLPKPDTRKHPSTGQPSFRDAWLWDDYSAQPSVMLRKRERDLERRKADLWPTLKHGLAVAPRLYRHYKTAQANAYTQPINMRQRLGVSVEVDSQFEQQRQQLLAIPGASLMVRCYFHLGSDHIKKCKRAIETLKVDGHRVSLALIQSRQAVINPALWVAFVDEALAALHNHIDAVEIGHAVNRVKWGLWNLDEIRGLWPAEQHWRITYPHLLFLGPAVNDFEFQYYPPLLARAEQQFDALSGHLYVDRRGAPENAQSGFSTLEKSLLGKAMADAHEKSGFYITEVNWPLQNTGLYSPVAGAYRPQNAKENSLHVSEQDSAAFMIRYALIALCSGAVSGIWWWRLAHPGFGLVDNLDGWRERPGWNAFATFQQRLGHCTFLRRETRDGVLWWHFAHTETFNGKTDQTPNISLAYALTDTETEVPEGYQQRIDLAGQALPLSTDRTITVTPQPQYFIR